MEEETLHESSSSRTRAAIATYLRRVADALDDGEPVPVGESTTVDPPAEAEFEVELEREDEELSLEFELDWPEAEGGVDTDVVASDATFELYRDSADEWRWRLRHANGNVVADGGEGYTKKANAVNGIESVKKNAAGAPVEEQD